MIVLLQIWWKKTSTQFEFPCPNATSPTPTTVDKSIDNTVRMKSVRTQCDPMYFPEKIEQEQQQHTSIRNILIKNPNTRIYPGV